MRVCITLLLATILSGFAAQAEPSKENPGDLPAACLPTEEAGVVWADCYAALPETHGRRLFAAMMAGNQAVHWGNVEDAPGWYDRANPMNAFVVTDTLTHAYRAHAFFRAGRSEDAKRDAGLAWMMIEKRLIAPASTERLGARDEFRAIVLIIDVLQANKDPAFDEAVERVVNFAPRNTAGTANKVGVLKLLKRYDEAYPVSAKLVELNPEDALLLNNHCYLLFQMGRSQEGIPFCERALAIDRDPAILHSYASVLGASGQCDKAEDVLSEARTRAPDIKAYHELPKECVKP